MGSASRIALADALAVLNSLDSSEQVGAQLLEATRVLSQESGLLNVFADAAGNQSDKAALIQKVFSAANPNTIKVLEAVAEGRWSNAEELVAGVEELGVRAEAISTKGLDEELIAIEKVISSDHELELTLGSKLQNPDDKAKLVSTLFSEKASAAALNVTKHLVVTPRGRRVGKTLLEFARVVADQGGNALATVTVAKPLSAEKLTKLEEILSKNEGRSVKITTVVDPEIIGGMRIRIGDEVIDGTVKSKLDDLRLKLAG